MKHVRAKTLEDKFFALIEEVEGCWIWKGTVTTKGGLYFRHQRKIYNARKVGFEINYGEVPIGYCLSCTCINKLCVHPDHVEMRLISNLVKDNNKSARDSKSCKKGHPLVVDGRGKRKCLECAKIRMRQYRKARR